jgi:hypothetical protein
MSCISVKSFHRKFGKYIYTHKIYCGIVTMLCTGSVTIRQHVI